MFGSARMIQLAIKLCLLPLFLPMLKEDMALEFNFFNTVIMKILHWKKDVDK